MHCPCAHLSVPAYLQFIVLNVIRINYISAVLYFDVLERLRHHNSSMLNSKIELEFISLSFSLDGKVPKDQGFITMLAFLSQRYLLAIQGMKKHNKS